MFPYKTYLKFNQPHSDHGGSTIVDEYPVSECDYEMGKATLPGGEIASPLRSGTIRLSLPQLPAEALLAWMFQPDRLKQGILVTYNLHQEVMEKVSFSAARVIQLRFHYESIGMQNATTLLTIHAQSIIIGEHELVNTWK